MRMNNKKAEEELMHMAVEEMLGVPQKKSEWTMAQIITLVISTCALAVAIVSLVLRIGE